MKNIPLKLMSLSIALLVAGCGGGGGSTNTPGVTIPTAAVKITSSNATAVAKSTNNAAQSTTSQGSAGAAKVVGVVAQPTGRLPSARSIALSEFKRILSTKLPAPSVIGAIPSETVNCTSGQPATSGAANTLTTSYSVAGSSVASGDSFTISYTSCALGGVTMNGSMTFAITTLTGSYGVAGASAGFKMTYGNLTMSLGSDSISMDGDMSITASSDSMTGDTSATISGTSFTISATSGGTTDSMRMTNYNESYSETTTGNFTYSIDMTLAGTAMGGSITIATTTNFTGNTNLNNGEPTAGEMTISGASGSSLTIIATSTGITYSGTDGTTPFGPTDVAWANL